MAQSTATILQENTPPPPQNHLCSLSFVATPIGSNQQLIASHSHLSIANHSPCGLSNLLLLLHTYMHKHTYIQTDRQTDRQADIYIPTDRHGYRQTAIHTYIHADKQINTHTLHYIHTYIQTDRQKDTHTHTHIPTLLLLWLF